MIAHTRTVPRVAHQVAKKNLQKKSKSSQLSQLITGQQVKPNPTDGSRIASVDKPPLRCPDDDATCGASRGGARLACVRDASFPWISRFTRCDPRKRDERTLLYAVPRAVPRASAARWHQHRQRHCPFERGLFMFGSSRCHGAAGGKSVVSRALT